MSTLGNIVRYIIVFITVIPVYSLAILVGIIHRNSGWNIVVRCNKFFLRLFKISLEVEFHTEPDNLLNGGVLVGLNQESILDPMVGIAASPVIFKTFFNIEYALVPFIGWIAWLFGYVIIRQRPAQSRRKLLKAASYLREGGYVYLSIEGRRSKDGALGAYKKGPAVLATQARTKIIPIVFHGSGKCMPYGSWKIRPGTIVVKILPPLSTEGLTYDDRDMLVSKLRTIAVTELSKTGTE